MAPRIVVLANPASGLGKARKLIPRIAEALASLGGEVRVSAGPADPPRLAREAAEEGAEVVAAMGGDGMVGMVASGLAATGAALGVIPTGTGNDFAKMLGIPKKPLDAVRILGDHDLLTIDTARITADGREARFVNVAGAGFDSEVNETANRMRTRIQGTAKYVAAVVKTLRVFRPAEFRVTVDGEERTLSGMLIAVGNGRSYGGGMKVCPDASLTDGLLEVCVVGGMGKGEFLRAFPRVFRGTHVSHPKVTMLRGKRIEIGADRAFTVYADGEASLALPATFEVEPAALRVAVPRGQP